MVYDFDRQVQRNTLGQLLEKDGKVEDAIALYETNVSEGFEGSYPYRRLALLYRDKKSSSEEIRVLEKAICVFESLIPTGRSDIEPKLNEFKESLKKARSHGH